LNAQRRAKTTLRFDHLPRENALRPAQAILIDRIQRKTADRNAGGPRYGLCGLGVQSLPAAELHGLGADDARFV
jgi:hypothetical protein